ncbi:substrate-binding domain-containing protein [Frankia sp. ACN1ag]|uniref:substrate-binding domain-containing protein n=1 Tax=Frankia sp. ACN1ag TaxID=102891 RepID=UPI00137A7010|nr:substrate-binding domain-containing protein [Frankia sp. ACN1ag]
MSDADGMRLAGRGGGRPTVSTNTFTRVLNGGGIGRFAARSRNPEIPSSSISRSDGGMAVPRPLAKVWAAIFSDTENPFFSGVLRGVEAAAARDGYSILLCNADEDLDRENAYLDLAVLGEVAGVIVAPTSEEETDLGRLLDHGTPVVTVDRRALRNQVDGVLVDNAAGACSGTEHLISEGFSRIALIGGPLRTTTARERREGYERALRLHGIEPRAELAVFADYKRQGGYDAMSRLLRTRPRPEAVLVSNNLMAVGALEALREARCSVPRDMGLVAFDEFPWNGMQDPPITTIEQPFDDIGRSAADLLLSRLAGSAATGRTVVLNTELRIRESSVKNRGADLG